MQNPWTHDDVPKLSSGSTNRMKLLGAIVWGFLILGIGAGVLYASRGMVDVSSLGTAFTAVSVLVVVAIAVPILKKLLAISRTLATVAFLIKLGLITRFLIL